MSSKRSSNMGTMKASVYQPPGRKSEEDKSKTAKCSLRSLAEEPFLEYNLLKRHGAVVNANCDTSVTEKTTVSVTVPIDINDQESKKITMGLGDFFTLTGEVKGLDEEVEDDDIIDDAIQSLRATLWAKGKFNVQDNALVTEGKGLKASLELFNFEKSVSEFTGATPPDDPVEREVFDWLQEQAELKLEQLRKVANGLIDRHVAKVTLQEARPDGLTSYGERALKSLFALDTYPTKYVEFLWSKEAKKNPLMTIKELTTKKMNVFSWCKDLATIAQDPTFVRTLKREVQEGANSTLPNADDPVFGKILNLTVNLPGPPGHDCPVASPEADKKIGIIQLLAQTVGLLHAGKHVTLLGKIEQGNWLSSILPDADKPKLSAMTPDQIREYAKDFSKTTAYPELLKKLFGKQPNVKFGMQVTDGGVNCFHASSEKYEIDISALAAKMHGWEGVKDQRSVTTVPMPVLASKEEAERLSKRSSVNQTAMVDAMEKKLKKLSRPCQKWFAERDWRAAPLSKINKLYKKLTGPAAINDDRKMFLLNQYREKLQEAEVLL